MTNSHHEITIRRATLEDSTALSTLGGKTFTDTFGHLYPAEDLQTFLSDSHSLDAWQRTLSDPERAVWIATYGAVPIGFIAVGPCKLPVENREANAGEIHQLYVLAQHHNLRLGSRLMAVGLEWLQLQNRTPLYIGVWSENIGAQRFYGRYGFSKVGEYGFVVGTTVDHEFILKR
jgi:ribosomal protein S18 acetylase RimI-like enzyme